MAEIKSEIYYKYSVMSGLDPAGGFMGNLLPKADKSFP